jgi:CRP-like cAMP-binding protein
MDDLLGLLHRELRLPEARGAEFVSIGKVRSLPKGSFFIEAGAIPKKFAFLIKGLIRYVYVDSKGTEYTKGLIPEMAFVSSYSSMILQSASHFSIEALEKSEILEISHQNWLSLRDSHPYWYKFQLGLVERGYTIKETRERELLLLDAETRYQNFLRDYPGMEKRVKQHIVASFLGIQPESLSRIKEKLIS